MRILISGATGLVGTELTERLRELGHTPIALSRSPGGTRAEVILWDPNAGEIDSQALEGLDAVVHLAGENVSDGRWNEEKKQRILESRVRGTTLLCNALAGLKKPPATLISASAMGYYGDTGDTVVDEASPPGDGFLADVCRQWEASTGAAETAGIRVVHYRIGLVLSAKGGALAKMLPGFKAGLAGPLGDGTMWMSWIALDDLVRGMVHCITNDAIHGPVNAVSPNPVRNRTFTKALGATLHRPTLIPAPAFAIRLALGEMGEELLLSSIRITPARLLGSGFTFEHEEISETLTHLLND